MTYDLIYFTHWKTFFYQHVRILLNSVHFGTYTYQENDHKLSKQHVCIEFCQHISLT